MSAPEKGRRLGERVKEVMAQHLPKLKDPRVGFVTVTDVRMSRDNDRATVYYTVLPDTPEQRERTAEGIASAVGLLRRELGRVLTVRHIPELDFRIDDVADSSRRIEAILAEVRAAEQDGTAEQGATAEPGGAADPDGADGADGAGGSGSDGAGAGDAGA